MRASSSPVTDVTSGLALLTVQGPKSRELLQRLSPDDWSNEAFPYLTAQKVELGVHAAVGATRHVRR